jgi:glycosyltransferase involved in cell wall biosynthesis
MGHAGIGRPDMWQVRMRPNVHVVLTQHAYDWVKDLFPEQKVVIIPNGIDPFRFHPNVEKILLALEHPIFLCAAALIPYKNINLTIDAVASLQSGSLLVLGTGALEKEIKDYGNRKLGENRFLLKAVAYADIPPYFASCDVFTLASEKECEAFGIVYLEAMACNKPVVATDDPIRLEIIADAGFLCDGYDVEKYSQNLLRAVHENFGDKPRQRAESFSWYFVARKYRQLLEKIIFEMETNLSES